MKKKTAIFLIITALLVVLTFTLTACNINVNDITATYQLDGNDGLNDFVLRRGVYFNSKVTELNKIDGVEASWKADGSTVKITVSNGKAHSAEVSYILNGKPDLKFKTENTAAADTQFVGKDNIDKITLSADQQSIRIEFTAQGVDAVNDYHNRQLYLYFGDEYLLTMTSKIILTTSSAAVTVPILSTSDPLYADTLAAKLNAATFGLKIKSVKIKNYSI